MLRPVQQAARAHPTISISMGTAKSTQPSSARPRQSPCRRTSEGLHSQAMSLRPFTPSPTSPRFCRQPDDPHPCPVPMWRAYSQPAPLCPQLASQSQHSARHSSSRYPPLEKGTSFHSRSGSSHDACFTHPLNSGQTGHPRRPPRSTPGRQPGNHRVRSFQPKAWQRQQQRRYHLFCHQSR